MGGVHLARANGSSLAAPLTLALALVLGTGLIAPGIAAAAAVRATPQALLAITPAASVP